MNATQFKKSLQRAPMGDDALRAAAPSIFATQASAAVSEKYSFVPTSRVLDGLRSAGWTPVYAREQRSVLEENAGYNRHMVKLHRLGEEPMSALGDLRMELTLVNAHNLTSAFQLHLGAFRLACLNGLVVSDSFAERVSVRHTGLAVDEVVAASLEIGNRAGLLKDAALQMQARHLSPAERFAFAEKAAALKYGSVAESPVSPDALLGAKRYQDSGADLWSTFNVVQEHLLQGGDRGRSLLSRNRVRTRPVKSIGEDLRLNRSLWALAESLRNQVSLTA